jgi:hypothetical protein
VRNVGLDGWDRRNARWTLYYEPLAVMMHWATVRAVAVEAARLLNERLPIYTSISKDASKQERDAANAQWHEVWTPIRALALAKRPPVAGQAFVVTLKREVKLLVFAGDESEVDDAMHALGRGEQEAIVDRAAVDVSVESSYAAYACEEAGVHFDDKRALHNEDDAYFWASDGHLEKPDLAGVQLYLEAREQDHSWRCAASKGTRDGGPVPNCTCNVRVFPGPPTSTVAPRWPGDDGTRESPRHADVGCSQCGRSFGPGDHGFSHCDNHTGWRSRG